MQKKSNVQGCKKNSDLSLEKEALSILLVNREFNPVILQEELFTDNRHQKILAAMKALNTEQNDWGIADVMARVDDSDYILSLTNTYLSSAEFPRLIRNLNEFMIRRYALNFADKLKCGEISLKDYLDSIKAIQVEVRQPSTISTVFAEYIAFIDEHATEGLPVIKTGFNFIDKRQGGLFPGDVGTIAGRPGKGKTTLMANMAFNIASLGTRVQFISLEMSALKILYKILARKIRISSQNFRIPQNLTDFEISQIIKAGGEIEKLPFYIDSDCGNDIGTIESLVQSASSQIVFIDYLGLIHTSEGSNTAEKIGFIMKRLKALARRKQCVIVVAAQINREGDKAMAEKEIPSLRHLKSSGSIEEDSDFVIMLNTHQRTYDEYQIGAPARMELWLAKNRDGDCLDNIQMEFNLKTQTITEKLKE